jgi:hypothetical protein
VNNLKVQVETFIEYKTLFKNFEQTPEIVVNAKYLLEMINNQVSYIYLPSENNQPLMIVNSPYDFGLLMPIRVKEEDAYKRPA